MISMKTKLFRTSVKRDVCRQYDNYSAKTICDRSVLGFAIGVFTNWQHTSVFFP